MFWAKCGDLTRQVELENVAPYFGDTPPAGRPTTRGFKKLDSISCSFLPWLSTPHISFLFTFTFLILSLHHKTDKTDRYGHMVTKKP